MNINNMTRKQFEALPSREWNEDIGEFDSLVILPTRRKHDSNYGVMDFVACRGSEPLVLLSGCSDVLHIDGIGGYGEWDPDKGLPRSVTPKNWRIDLLFKSKLFRIFAGHRALTCGQTLSSFELYANPIKKG